MKKLGIISTLLLSPLALVTSGCSSSQATNYQISNDAGSGVGESVGSVGGGQGLVLGDDAGGSAIAANGNDAGNGAGDGGSGSGSGDAAQTDDDGPSTTPSAYLMITAARLATLRATANASNPRWVTLKANVDANITDPNALTEYNSSPENAAVVYLFTQDPQYAAFAYTLAAGVVAAESVQADSYLGFGDQMREVAMVLNYCYPALTAAQQSNLETFLDQWTNQLWNDNQGSGWGLADPGNNYHLAFLEGTAFAGYALREVGNADGASYITILNQQLNAPAPEGELQYLNGVAADGEWLEGSNYGERSKARLFRGLAAVASMDGTNYFTQSPFFANSIYFQIYGTQPNNTFFYPGGDLARASTMPISPYDREIVQLATFFTNDATARGYGQGFLTSVIPDYTGPSFDDPLEYYLDFLFAPDNQPATPESQLPLSYQGASSGWANLRSGWDANATSVSISGAPLVYESHQHDDVGSFVIWNGGWLAGDASTWSHSGEIQTPDAHNMINVEGTVHDVANAPGATLFYDESAYGYAQIDGSNQFSTGTQSLLAEWTRELIYLRAQNVVVVYDRVNPTAGQTYDWRIHFPVQPTLSGTAYTVTSQGSSIALQPVSGGTPTVNPDTDLSDPTATSFRVQEAPTQTPARLLNLVGVATGAPPDVTSQHVTGAQVEGVLWSNQVVMFSSNPRGAAPTLPFTYTVPSATSPLTHTLTNLPPGGINVAVIDSGGQTTVTVSAGSQYTPSSAGTVAFTM